MPHVRLTGLYGMTETGIISSLNPADHETKDENMLKTVGRPVPWLQLRVVDVVTREPVPRGCEGEVQVKAPTVMTCYYCNDAATESAFEDGWFNTGDIAQQREDDCVVISGRCKDVILQAGFAHKKVLPDGIDKVLNWHNLVHACVTVGIPVKTYDPTDPNADFEYIESFIELNPGHSRPTKEQLVEWEVDIKQYLTEKLDNENEVPTRVHFLPVLPRTGLGKLRRVEVRKLYVAGELDLYTGA
eukprot:TRINITY_DN51142_c0_g3_i1.p1 TRINITY_DN51142_c0_g3~~TRINITY_DN51142_c0_g3_i1.p1  ORF type:complete len:275 (-),score=30.18 TRINITY_DN51142_c0_g3_i1:86-817(-)